MKDQQIPHSESELDEYFTHLGSDLSRYQEFEEETQTLEDFVSHHNKGDELSEALRTTDKVLEDTATVTLGYTDTALASGVDDQYLMFDSSELTELRFEDSIEELRSKSRPSWIFGVQKSPTNIKTRNAHFRAYFDVHEDDSKKLEADELTNLQLQLPSVYTMRNLNGRERYAVQSRLEVAEGLAMNENTDYGTESLREEFEHIGKQLGRLDPSTDRLLEDSY